MADAALREAVARALCAANHGIVPWKTYLREAEAAIAVVVARCADVVKDCRHREHAVDDAVFAIRTLSAEEGK